MMLVLVSLLLAFAILCFIFYWTTLEIFIQSKRKGKDNYFHVRIRAWFRLIEYDTEIPIIKLSEDKPGVEYDVKAESPTKKLDEKKISITLSDVVTSFQKLHDFIQKVYGLHIIVKHLLKNVRLKQLEWKSTIGTGDAAETGMLSGLAWGIKASFVGFFASYTTLQCLPNVQVISSFQQKKMDSNFVCMFRLRIGHAILAGIRIALHSRKRRDVKWQSTQFRA
ncbi:DUF2953 domain-containing protein [Bacillus horti]|uniref:DUF2953 domain-containing protein n=1 Tax=Caldalkalibacillus horti TaxID=77523 RepID=A0ABT9W4E2_9BACI|nr:DUF2953 domain-containing protein [Bacillus horti]MDQ0168117.1 hypothetical protein [Bacillus horti]